MPTIILLDVSLSMTRPVNIPDTNEEYQRRHLAIQGINTLLDHITTHSKLEFISLMIFSSQWEQVVNFTRDVDSIKSALTKLDDYDKTNVCNGLQGVLQVVTEEWGTNAPCQIVLITDGSTGTGSDSLKHHIQYRDTKFPLPFPFPSKLHICCVGSQEEPSVSASLPLYNRLIDLNGGKGGVFVPEGSLNITSIQQLFSQLAEKYFSPFNAVLNCGNLKCKVQLFPAPEDYKMQSLKKSVSNDLQILGFVDIQDVASPAGLSRHLVLPNPPTKEDESQPNGEKENKDIKEDEEETDEFKTPSFTVLLHGALKVHSMIALTQIGEDWYGMLYSFADNRKKSNLMLTIYEPGKYCLPWLGNMDMLAPATDFPEPPYGEDDNKSPFPVRPKEKRSYANNCVVWLKASGVQADIQKMLRHARKLPEKQQHFYKELNRLRRAALSYGFTALLKSVALMLERECTCLPGSSHPDAALQLTHAANALKSEQFRDITQNIVPLRTNFSEDS
ncbi:unnamed protein product [Owenia fusiformis]|uniref:Integrator complex subunit 14 n=1 Tax=Owenia fusiformis TaxID=6347 RepID=A0A8J1TX10_OWEFU|nr:unnamed protein product [Owenia fusiformis]